MTRIDPHTGKPAPTVGQSVIWGAAIIVVGLAFLAGAAWMIIRVDGDLGAYVSDRFETPAWFAATVVTVIGLVIAGLGVLTIAIGTRAARRADAVEVGRN